MGREIEAKFTNVNKNDLRQQFRRVGAILINKEFIQKRFAFYPPRLSSTLRERPRIETIEDSEYIIFNNNQRLKVNDSRLAIDLINEILSEEIGTKQNTSWLRVRDEDLRITLTYKSEVSKTIDGMVEIEVIVDNFDLACQLLEYLGCMRKAYHETKRELWVLNEVQITIDEWPYLPPFVEVEGKNVGEVESIAKLLGFDWEMALFCSVGSLYASEYGISEQKVNETARITFDDPNPFEAQGMRV